MNKKKQKRRKRKKKRRGTNSKQILSIWEMKRKRNEVRWVGGEVRWGDGGGMTRKVKGAEKGAFNTSAKNGDWKVNESEGRMVACEGRNREEGGGNWGRGKAKGGEMKEIKDKEKGNNGEG